MYAFKLPVGGAEFFGQDLADIVSGGSRRILSLPSVEPGKLVIFNKCTKLLPRLIKYPGLTIIGTSSSIYRRGFLMIYGHVKMNLGVNGPNVSLGFYF